jgi:Flp pilus assembly protein TadD
MAVAIVVVLVVAGAGVASADPDLELHDTVSTRASRASLSAPLVKLGDRAARSRDWSRAIPLYQAIVIARGPGSNEARKLATLWTLAGQSAAAADVLTAFATSTTDVAARREAEAEAARLTANPDPFARELQLASIDVEAKKLFKRGRAALKTGDHGDALVVFRMGLALAPDMPGFLRELGATYDKLGARDKKIAFYRRYLTARPFGGNADVVRAELGKDPKALGKLEITTSLPCEQLWVNRQRLPAKLPKGGLAVAPGTYKGLCYTPRYEIALFQYTTVESGATAKMQFDWAIVVNELDNPLGRISIENAQQAGMMIDLGISSREIGVAVPADRRALKMVLKDDAGERVVERTIELAPGQRKVVKW